MYYVCDYYTNDIFYIAVYEENPVENQNAKPVMAVDVPAFLVQYICTTFSDDYSASRIDKEMEQYVRAHCFNRDDLEK